VHALDVDTAAWLVPAQSVNQVLIDVREAMVRDGGAPRLAVPPRVPTEALTARSAGEWATVAPAIRQILQAAGAW
jgi:hypothetical protein